MEIVQGKITSLSHLIYIRPKTLFVELSWNDGKNDLKKNVMIRIKSQHVEWRDKLVLRHWVRIDNLKEVSLCMGSNRKAILFETTPESKLIQVDKGIAYQSMNQKADNLINYEGEVTDDSFRSMGFYELDKSLILCLTYMKLVSNVPVIYKGDSIVLHNIHKLRVKEKVFIFLCGKGTLVNRSKHAENDCLHPKHTSGEEDFLQEFALENSCGISRLFLLYHFCKELYEKFNGILTVADITRTSASAGVKGVLACLVEHFSSFEPVVPKSRFFSREFLDHAVSGCAPAAKELNWKIDRWPLDVNQIESRCNRFNLWTVYCPGTDNDNNSVAKVHYWQHDVADIDSGSDHISISLLIGVLSFRNGRWELRDNSGSLECIAPDRHCNQYQNQLVFTTQFAIHREVFYVDRTQIQRVYVSIDQLRTTALPVPVPISQPQDMTASKDHVEFLVMNKSSMLYFFHNHPTARKVFGYLVVISLLQPTTTFADETERPVKCSRVQLDSPEHGPDSCILLFHHSTSSYPSLTEGQVYQLLLPRDMLFKNQ